MWVLELAFSLAEQYYERYGNKFHKCLTHLERLQKLGPPPLIAEETAQPDPNKCATTGLPEGIEYFHCAIHDDFFNKCAVYSDGKLNAIETYRRYYAFTRTWTLKWNRSELNAPKWFLALSKQV